MSVSVGGVTIDFDGDASGAKAAMQAVAEKLDVLVAKERDLKVALDAATASGKVSETALGALRSAHAEATNAVKRLTGELKNEEDAERAAAAATKAAAEAAKAAERAQQEQARAAEKAAAEARKAAETHGVYGEKARSLDNAMGTLQTSIGGVSSAFGVQGQQMTDAVGAVADVAKAFGSGGPLLAALALAGAAVAAIGAHFAAAAEKAREAMKKIMDDAQAMSDQLQQDLDNLRQLEKEAGFKEATAGLSEEQKLTVKAFLDTADATKALRDFEARFGLMAANVNSRLAGTQEMVRDPNKVPVEVVFGYTGDPSFNKYADLLVKTYAQLQEKVKATVSSGQAQIGAAKAEKGVEAGKAAADTAIQSAFDKLTRSLDANTAALEVDAELSVNEYTAEDRASREDRGVFEVSKEDFDARLAGIDPEEAKKLFEEGLNAILNPFGEATETITIGLTDTVNATADDIAKMNEAFLSVEDAAIDLRDPLEQFGDGVRDAFDKLGGASGLAVTAIEGGASGLGQAAGGAVGGVIGTAVGGPGGTAVGSALGSLIGGLLGDSLDKLIEALGILTPLFDAIGTIIGALQPILVVLGGLFITLADAIVALAPVILILARLFGANLVILVRLLQVILLLVPIISMAASFILVWVDFIVMAIDMIDKNFLRPLFDGAAFLVNGFIMFYNSIIDLIRLIPGLDKFGSKAELISYGAGSGAAAGVDDMINDVSEAAALAAAEGAAGGAGGEASGGADTGSTETTSEESWSNEMANVPSGFKALAAIYANADAESGSGTLARPEALSMVINIENWNSRGDSQRDWEDLRRYARQGHKGKKAASSRSFGDEKN
jgi:hypothetical protein